MSGDGLVAPLNAPPATLVQPGVQPGVTGPLILAQYVVVFGTNDGVFIYSGTPAKGNPPVISITSPSATDDPYGNAILSDLVVGQNSMGQIRMIPGNPSFIEFITSGTWQTFPSIGLASASGLSFQILGGSDTTGKDFEFWELLSGIAGSGAEAFLSYQDGNGGTNTQLQAGYFGVNLPVVAQVLAVKPGTGTSPTNPAAVETWHAMSPLLNSWAAQASPNVQPQYRRVASPNNTVEVIGSLSAAAATAITFFQLPANYRPSSQQPFPVGTFSGSSALDNVIFGFCDTSGNLTIQQRSASATGIYFHGFISLDA